MCRQLTIAGPLRQLGRYDRAAGTPKIQLRGVIGHRSNLGSVRTSNSTRVGGLGVDGGREPPTPRQAGGACREHCATSTSELRRPFPKFPHIERLFELG